MYEAVFQGAATPMILLDEAGETVDCNQACRKLFDTTPGVLKEFLAPGADADSVLRHIRRSSQARLDLKSRLAEPLAGRIGWCSRVAYPTGVVYLLEFPQSGERAKAFRQQTVLVRNVNALRKRELGYRKQIELLGERAERDALTGLANRRLLDRALPLAWTEAGSGGTPVSMLMIDIDCFKQYNDELGHPAGDTVLIRVSAALAKGARRATDIVVRLGGEEFGILLPGLDETSATNVATAVMKAVDDLAIPHPASDAGAIVTVSVGVATLTPAKSLEPAALIRQADRALYRAKQAGRHRVVFDGGSTSGPAAVANA
ncbi:MAG: sensor domain-containing diguanylate cyclase [Salinisphaeraceae bacterium]